MITASGFSAAKHTAVYICARYTSFFCRMNRCTKHPQNALMFFLQSLTSFLVGWLIVFAHVTLAIPRILFVHIHFVVGEKI